MNIGVLTLLGTFVAAGPTVPAGQASVHGSEMGMPVSAPAQPGKSAGAVRLTVPTSPVQTGPAVPGPAPLLAAKILAPKGVRVTVHPGTKLARMFDAPAIFGFRPGYIYRLELSNLPYQPGRVLYPVVEVHGVLVPRSGMKYMDWPAPLLFTTRDIERALAGAYIAKAVYLEDPEKAIPSEFGPNAPFEVPVGSEDEAIKGAIASGRLVAIVRLGSKLPTPDELTASAIDGTVLSPGERYLRGPSVPPMIPFYGCKMYDPISGPRGPKEECLVDGGDKLDPLGIGPNGRLGGLDPTDVGVEYTMSGRRRVTSSNVVCLCVPRFMIQRAEIAPSGVEAPSGLVIHSSTTSPQSTRERLATMAEIGREKPVGVVTRQRSMAYVGRVGTTFFLGATRTQIIGQIDGLKMVGVVVEPEQLTAYPSLSPLTVTKSVDPAGKVQIGDIVTFTIRFVNTGNKPISDIAVSDSLSGRLEFIPGSAQSDRAANFTAGDNEVGSVVVRWDLPGVLLPGQGGVVKFKAKVR